MTDCPRGDIRDVLPELVHNQLDPARRAVVEHHVANCSACREEVALLRSMRSALSRTPAIDVARIAAIVREATRAPAVSPADVRRLPRRRHAVWADWRVAAGIAAVVVGALSYTIARNRTPSASQPREVASVSRGQPAPGAQTRAVVRTGTAAESIAPARPRPKPATTLAAREHGGGISLDGGVGDLPDGDLKALIQSVDKLNAVPDTAPAPVLDLNGPGDGETF